MNEQPACQGCYVNPDWTYIPPMFPPIPNWIGNMFPLIPMPPVPPVVTPFIATQPFVTGLTNEEQAILSHLADAYRLFVDMDNKHPDDNDEFRKAIHDAQKMIALRGCRRVAPHIWHQPDPT